MNRSRPISWRAATSAGAGLAHAHPHVLVEVLRGRPGQGLVGAVADLAGGARARMPSSMRVELGEQRRHPRAAGLGHHELEAREALEHARQRELHEGALRVEDDLVDVEQHRRRVGPVVRVAGAAVHVHRDLEVLADLPQPVVLGVVERLHPLHVGGDVGQQDAAAQAVLLDPVHVLDRVVDVVQEDLARPRPAAPGTRCTSRRAIGCGRARRPAGARTPRRWAAWRRARSSGRTAARCSGRRPRRRRRPTPAASCASRCPSCAAAGCRPGPCTGSCTCPARRRSPRGTPGRGTRGRRRATRPRGSRPR